MNLIFLAASENANGMNHEVVTTLSLAIAAGALLMVLAKKLQVPGIVLLLFGGVILGPSGIGVVQPDTLGPILNVLVAVAIGLILFEGGLTLNMDGYRTAPKVIINLLTVGVAVTWFVNALAVWLIFPVSPLAAILAASLVIVTGPTVIQPILKRIRVKWNLHHILHWEGVLIDPIGVFLAILAYEWVVVGFGEEALFNLLLRIFGGLVIGFIGGELISWILKKKFIHEEVLNVFIIGSATIIFGVTEMLILEGGLLSVTVAGLICGSRQPPALKGIVEFKGVITDLLIGFVFILLTARLDLNQFTEFGLRGYLLVAVVILVSRPMAIFLSSFGSDLKFKEKVFLSWVGPRGVVAASMASLFTLNLAGRDLFPNPVFLETFVYSVIFITVLLQGFSAGPLSKLFKLNEKHPDGWLIVGAHPVARKIAEFLVRERKVPVALIDGNRRAVVEAQEDGLVAFFADARETRDVEDKEQMRGIGKLLAFTDNEDLNELLCKKWEDNFGAGHVYRWGSTPTVDQDVSATGTLLWSWMPKPSMMSSELMLGEAALVELEGERLANPGNLAALLTANSKEVLLDPGPESKLKTDKTAQPKTLYLQREADYLLNALNPEWILRVEPKDKKELFMTLAAKIADSPESNINLESTYNQIMERENAAPTTLGHGIAVPHAKIDGLDRTVCLIAQVPNGITFYEDDPSIVNLVFLLLSPPDQPEMHLAVLGEIARLCAESSVREKLITCEDISEIMVLIRRYRRQHTAFADARG